MIDFYQEALAEFGRMQAQRRDFHQHPELGFQEYRTAGIVTGELTALGLEVKTGVAKTGVVGLLEGGRSGPTLLARFDMDALPIVEQTGAEYASQHHGVMHACGHDAHTAVGLAVARILQRNRAELRGTVKFVFQPAEEGLGGAEGMIAEGVLEDPKPERCLGLHVWNQLPVGKLGISEGAVMASADIFTLKIQGRGGHGAMPNYAIDPITCGAQIIQTFQTIISRRLSPLKTGVLSVCSIHAGEAFNVIPDTLEMKGTVRTYDPVSRSLIVSEMERIANSVAEAMGCTATVEVTRLTPPLINLGETTAQVAAAARRTAPHLEIDPTVKTMGSEDMAFLMEKVPGCFFFVGSANAEKGLNAEHHHPKFDIDEESLVHAAAVMASAVFEVSGSPAG